MVDYIIIQELDVRCRVGCTAEERSYPQRLVLSFRIGIDSRNAARTGDLGDTVCYQTVSETVSAFLLQGDWPLLEQLGEDITKFILEQFPAAKTCDLEVRKFAVPGTAWVGLQLHRNRQLSA